MGVKPEQESLIPRKLTRPRSGSAARKVLDVIDAAGDYGATDWEIHKATALQLFTVASRRLELMKEGWIEDAGWRTTDGVIASVWVLSRDGMWALTKDGARAQA
jgi:hypothetical protein